MRRDHELTGTHADLDLSMAELAIRRRDDRAGRRESSRDRVFSWPCSAGKIGRTTITLREWRDLQEV